MEVKGNVIIHGSYIDIHDNEVVNLSVDKANVKVNGKDIRTFENNNSTLNNDLENNETPSLLSCIETLMEEKDEKGNYLVNQGNHWIAIFRIIVDKNLGASNTDYKGFCNMIEGMKPEGFRVPLKQDNLKAISKTIYHKSFDKWKYDSSYNSKRKPYDDMVAVAIRFKEILEIDGF